jgi:hypothetical protein
MDSKRGTAYERPSVVPPQGMRAAEAPANAEIDGMVFDGTRLRESVRPEPVLSESVMPGASQRALRGVRAPTERREPLTAFASAVGAPVVRRMLNRSGNSLFMAIEPLPEQDFFAAGANGISIAWTIGHLACVFDLFTSWIHGTGPKLPKAVHDTFNSLDVKAPGGPNKAEIVRASGYSKADIQYLLRTAQIQALKLLDACKEHEWAGAPVAPHPDNLHTVGEIWEHLAVHTYWHMGELCGTFPRFHGTYTLNMLPHYFFYMPPDNDHG